ncbi:unnamed protein product [Coregonus sp. 'balchen']|nr:unnamed protein product [Coregonus sp. 'balchen']
MFYQDDCGEKTIMFTGEDTVLIANDSESSIVLPHAIKVRLGVLRTKQRIVPPLKTTTSARDIDPEFEHFLASLTKSSGPRGNPTTMAFHRAASPPEKTDNRCFLAALNAHRSRVDKENQVPALSTTQRDCTVASVSPQRLGPQFMNTSTMQTEQDQMDLTKTHRTLIDGKGVFQCVQTVRPEEQRLRGSTFSQVSVSTDPDEMELTRSQTVAIDSKAIGMIGPNPPLNIESRSVVFTSDSNKTQIFSDDDHGMEMTAALNVPLRENVCALTKKGGSPLSQINRPFISPHAQTQMTRCQTVAIDSKSVGLIEIPLLGNTRKRLSCMKSSQRGVFFTEDCNGMDMTEALTENIRPMRNCLNMTDETTGRLFPITKHQKERFEKSQDRAELSTDDMEITMSQTGVIDARCLGVTTPSLRGDRGRSVSMLDSTKTLCGEDGNGMEMTQALTAQIWANVSPFCPWE